MGKEGKTANKKEQEEKVTKKKINRKHKEGNQNAYTLVTIINTDGFKSQFKRQRFSDREKNLKKFRFRLFRRDTFTT